MTDVFKALADPSRRLLLDALNARSGQTLTELCGELDMARQSVSKHLAVLEAAGVVTTVRRGREKLHHLDAAPINAIAERWISRYSRGRVEALADLAAALETPAPETTAPEEKAMTADEFVYTTYITTTPQQLWQALTEPAFTTRYWGVALRSAWTPGATVAWEQGGATITDPDQVVLEADPYRRLAYTWHTFTPEFAAANGITDDVLATIAAERRSRVSFDLEQVGEQVRLTVVHGGFEPGSTVLQMINGGWPKLLSDLKTLLERETAASAR